MRPPERIAAPAVSHSPGPDRGGSSAWAWVDSLRRAGPPSVRWEVEREEVRRLDGKPCAGSAEHAPTGQDQRQPRQQGGVGRRLLAAGLPRLRFHDLRHSCATLLLVQGVPARVIMEILGHSSIALTMNTYSHVLPSLKRDAADAMDRVLSGPPVG